MPRGSAAFCLLSVFFQLTGPRVFRLPLFFLIAFLWTIVSSVSCILMNFAHGFYYLFP